LRVQVEEQRVVEEVVNRLFEIVSCEKTVHKCNTDLLLIKEVINDCLRQAVIASGGVLTLPKLELKVVQLLPIEVALDEVVVVFYAIELIDAESLDI
jgi:hypothetical protein